MQTLDPTDNTNDKTQMFNMFKDKGVRIILQEGIAYFHAGDIAKNIGYNEQDIKNWRRWNINFVPFEILVHQKHEKINWKRTSINAIFLESNELKKILCKVSTSKSIQVANNLGIDVNYKYVRKEIEIWKNLEEFFGNAEIKHVNQHIIGKYKADVFLPEYNIIIEIDENDHKYYDKTKEKQRTKYLESHNYKILRINPDENAFSLNKLFGLITKNIIDVIKCIQ